MQKHLPEYFKFIIDKKDSVFGEFYENDAFMMSEDAVIIAGMLVGLNIIDCNDWCVKDEDLDFQDTVLDLSTYLKNSASIAQDVGEDENFEIKELLDQKNYLEEMNKHLKSTIDDMKRKYESSELSSSIPHQQVDHVDTKNPLSPDVLSCHREKQLDTLVTSSDDVPNGDVIKPPSGKNHEEAERELQLQININNELETAMKLLETDIHEKQDTIISLRRQLDDIKTINLQLYSRLKDHDNFLKSKNEQIERLEAKSTVDAKLILQLEEK